MKFGRIFLILSYVACVIFSFICWTVPISLWQEYDGVVYTEASHNERVNNFVTGKYNEETGQVDFWWMNTIKLHSVDAETEKYVWLGGDTLGFDYTTDGVLVVAKSVANENGIESGDVITSVNGENVSNVKDLVDAVNEAKDNEVNIKLLRDGEVVNAVVKPNFDVYSKRYKLGVWVKDGINGLGTLTYVTKEGDFGALGHPIVEPNTNVVMKVKEGKVYPCVVFGVQKASRGSTGELKGTFVSGGKNWGSITKNCEFGVFGSFDTQYLMNKTLVKVGGKMTMHPGRASIFCSIDGKNVKEYEIEIIKTNYKSAKLPQNFVFRVTDKELIAKTGGIVQGMSGSPIMQDGFLVGAVTHVFINDATKGFGTYIDNMLSS